MHDHHPGRDGHLDSDFSVEADEVTCRQFVELITDYFEGVLPSRTLSQVEEHLVMCDWCVTYSEQMQSTLQVLATLREEPTPEPGDELLAAVRARQETPR